MNGPASSWLFHHAGRIDPTLAVVAIPLGWRLITGTWQGIEDTLKIRRWLKHRRSRPDLACRTPGRMIQRLSGRTSHHKGPHMPSEDEITRRVGNPDYGPRHIEPAHTQPGPVRTRPDRRGLIAGLVAFLATVLVLAAIGGAYLLGHRGSGSTPTKAAAQDLTANAQGCQEFDHDMDFMHQALTDATPAPAFISMGAKDLRDKVPSAAALTTGETKTAMMRVSTYGQILIDKEQEFTRPGFDDSKEIGGLRDAWATVWGFCVRAGVKLANYI